MSTPPSTPPLAPFLDRLLPEDGSIGVGALAAASSRIRLRRFAGPESYAERIEHVRVAHLTDQHFGLVTPMAVQRAAVAITNAQRPDLVVLTGDFVCHSHAYLDQLEEILSRLSAPALAVLGNHDHWSGADEVRRSLRRAGVEVLDNASTIVTLGHERLQVVGLDDAYTGHARLERAVKGLRRDLPTIGLSHIAEEADGLWRHGVPLVFSGHTHAGHLTLARLHERAFGRITGHRYVHGLYGTRAGADPASAHDGHGRSAARGAVYVGAGIGASVVPFRLGDRAKSEVTLFELGYSPGDFAEHHAEQEPLPGRVPSEAARARRAAKVVANREKRERLATRSTR